MERVRKLMQDEVNIAKAQKDAEFIRERMDQMLLEASRDRENELLRGGGGRGGGRRPPPGFENYDYETGAVGVLAVGAMRGDPEFRQKVN